MSPSVSVPLREPCYRRVALLGSWLSLLWEPIYMCGAHCVCAQWSFRGSVSFSVKMVPTYKVTNPTPRETLFRERSATLPWHGSRRSTPEEGARLTLKLQHPSSPKKSSGHKGHPYGSITRHRCVFPVAGRRQFGSTYVCLSSRRSPGK